MKIEKGVPIPKQFGAKRPHGNGKWQRIAKLMEVDDCVFFAGDNGEYACFAKAMKNMGFNVVTRKVKDGYRVWRVE